MGRWTVLALFGVIAWPALLAAAENKSAPKAAAPARPAATAVGAARPAVGGVGAQVGHAQGGAVVGAGRSFGASGAAPAGGGRTFGGGTDAHATGGGRGFGAAQGHAADAPRSFGGAGGHEALAGRAPAGEADRHFGAESPHAAGAHETRVDRAGDGRAGGRLDEHGMALRGDHGFYTYHGERLRRFDAAPYHWRSGWAYRRWDVGHRFPREYWLRDYYIDDFAIYGLEAPPYGLQWIRYGPDILLINLETGEVVQAVYGAFPG